MDLNKECQWQPNPLESHYYPSRCWALILEARELERFYATRVKSEKDFPILPENSIISAAERLLRDYRTHRVPFLGHIAERSGTVPYTLRVTLYTLLTICSKLRGCGELVRDRLKGIVHTFLGNYNAEYESLLRGLLTEAMFPEYSAEKVNVYIFYTDVLCSLMRGTSEKVYPGAIDLLRKYFATRLSQLPPTVPGSL
ncbi:hypothetical protein NMY22_g7918 [Coprinellus aureogranulatus]|nr:hypothetical protein NMY22_g7918 [Coprinellus aureogranulatus]